MKKSPPPAVLWEGSSSFWCLSCCSSWLRKEFHQNHNSSPCAVGQQKFHTWVLSCCSFCLRSMTVVPGPLGQSVGEVVLIATALLCIQPPQWGKATSERATAERKNKNACQRWGRCTVCWQHHKSAMHGSVSLNSEQTWEGKVEPSQPTRGAVLVRFQKKVIENWEKTSPVNFPVTSWHWNRHTRRDHQTREEGGSYSSSSSFLQCLPKVACCPVNLILFDALRLYRSSAKHFGHPGSNFHHHEQTTTTHNWHLLQTRELNKHIHTARV